MKNIILLSYAIILIVFLMPMFVVKEPAVALQAEVEDAEAVSAAISLPGSEQKTGEYVTLSAVKSPEALPDSSIAVRVLSGGEVTEMPLDELLRGIVTAEMPALFPEEALKAQAIAARTLVYNRMANGGDGRHESADICTDPAHCVAYSSLEERAAELDAVETGLSGKIVRAVSGTDGLVALCADEPILAVFHAVSGGSTQNAEDVWGSPVSYLKSVQSGGEESAPKFHTELSITADEFRELMKAADGGIELTGDMDEWITGVIRSSGGAVTSVTVGGVAMSGSAFRTILGLNSLNFDFAADRLNDMLIFTVQGYGHGVGLSQYGAAALARDGYGCVDIIKWYYTGVDVGTYSLS